MALYLQRRVAIAASCIKEILCENSHNPIEMNDKRGTYSSVYQEGLRFFKPHAPSRMSPMYDSNAKTRNMKFSKQSFEEVSVKGSVGAVSSAILLSPVNDSCCSCLVGQGYILTGERRDTVRLSLFIYLKRQVSYIAQYKQAPPTGEEAAY